MTCVGEIDGQYSGTDNSKVYVAGVKRLVKRIVAINAGARWCCCVSIMMPRVALHIVCFNIGIEAGNTERRIAPKALDPVWSVDRVIDQRQIS